MTSVSEQPCKCAPFFPLQSPLSSVSPHRLSLEWLHKSPCWSQSNFHRLDLLLKTQIWLGHYLVAPMTTGSSPVLSWVWLPRLLQICPYLPVVDKDSYLITSTPVPLHWQNPNFVQLMNTDAWSQVLALRDAHELAHSRKSVFFSLVNEWMV